MVESQTGGYESHKCNTILQKSKNKHAMKRGHAMTPRYTACKQKSILSLQYLDRRKFLNLSIKI